MHDKLASAVPTRAGDAYPEDHLIDVDALGRHRPIRSGSVMTDPKGRASPVGLPRQNDHSEGMILSTTRNYDQGTEDLTESIMLP